MKLKAVIIGALLGIFLMACGGGSGESTDNPPIETQVRPVANAGPNRYCTVGEELTFDGSGSEDEDEDALTFQWELVELPATSQAAIVDPESPSPSITIDVEGIYTLQLIVNDGQENSNPDIVKVATSGMLIDSRPKTITLGTDNVVYLLSTSNNRIYRWSLSQQFPLNPIDVDASPTLMAYASTVQRIYLGYASGAITQIDLTSGVQESPFATLPDSPH
ncbi:MAG: PKD domain-containing protein, partial [Desulfobacteraceae bacterium]